MLWLWVKKKTQTGTTGSLDFPFTKPVCFGYPIFFDLLGFGFCVFSLETLSWKSIELLIFQLRRSAGGVPHKQSKRILLGGLGWRKASNWRPSMGAFLEAFLMENPPPARLHL